MVNKRQWLLVMLALAFARPCMAADKWQTPTPEELQMTSQPQVPGAAAVFLYREEVSDDNLEVRSIYVRMKVLTEKGKEYADVELPFADKTSITGIEGRTIQPDGTIVEFAGKPYTKTVTRGKNTKVQAKVFTLPAVNVGSILEFRYSWRYSEVVYSPTWMIQQSLYTRQAHFEWRPFQKGGHYIRNEDGDILGMIEWAENLPPGAKVESKSTRIGMDEGVAYSLDVHDIAPLANEESTPPMHSISERVEFFYTNMRSMKEFWLSEGKRWSKKTDSFIGPGKGVSAEVARITSNSDSPDDKLRKIYADVMTLENTDFTRAKDRKEAKPSKSTDDVLEQKSGDGEALTLLFIAMVRAAGFKADAAVVANREYRFFWPALLQFSQLQDYLAIVQVNGKDEYFDPAERYCPFGVMKWGDAASMGIRQTGGGNTIEVATPQVPYKDSQMQRVADLTMAEDGSVVGTVRFTWMGQYALNWRHRYLRTDRTELDKLMLDNIQEDISKGLKLELLTLENIDQFEKPVVAIYKVEGQLAEVTTKRMIVPAQFFQVNASPRFSATERTLPIDLHYGHRIIDACRISLPASMHWEEEPKPEKLKMKEAAQYVSSFEEKDNAVTMRRMLDVGEILFKASEYPELHDFYAKVATADSSQAVISLSPATGGGSHGQ